MPTCLQGVYNSKGKELRKTDLGQRKWRNEGKTVEGKMRASSTAMMTLSQVEAPIPTAPPRHSPAKVGETEYQRTFLPH